MFLTYKTQRTRTPDDQYARALATVMADGFYSKNPHQTHGRFAHYWLPPLVYQLDNGIPLITERAIPFWRKSIGEILAFIHGVRYLKDLEPWGCANFWEKSVTAEKCAAFGLEPGDLGTYSYGPNFHDMPTPDGRTFNQFYHLIRGIKWEPGLATHMVTSWYPPGVLQHDELQRKVVVAPCHGDLIKVSIVDVDKHAPPDQPIGKLILTQVQRSADMPIGVPSNIFQYATLSLMIAHVTRTIPFAYVHVFLDAQMYEDQSEKVRELLVREPRKLPTLHLTEEGERITDLFDFRPHHFELREYDPHPAMPGIPYTT